VAVVGPATSGPWRDQFQPDSGVEPWRNDATRWLVVSQGAPRHRAPDVVVNPGEAQVLEAKLAYGPFDKDLEGEWVEIWVRVACGDWRKIARLLSDGDGKIRHEIPAAGRLPAGTYPVKALVKGDHSQADFTLFVWPAGMHAIVSDIDGTITTQEFDGVWTALDPDWVDPRPGALETLWAYASKGYRVIYLSARPAFLTAATRRWFRERGFPGGIFKLSPSALGVSGSAAADYKGAYLEGLVRDQGVAIDGAYGNMDSDLSAYLRAGIAPDHVYLFGYGGDLRGANRFDDWASELARVRCLPPPQQP